MPNGAGKPGSTMAGAIKTHPVAVFYLLAIGISWLVWIPVVPALKGLMTLDVPIWAVAVLLFGAAGPMMAALITQYVLGGKGAITRLFADFARWRVPIRWYAAIFIIPISMFLVSVPLVAMLTGEPPTMDLRGTLLAIPTLALAYGLRFLFALPSGPLLEEMGWRGFAMPYLQKEYSALTAGALVGLMWGAWHLPLFWVPGAALPGGAIATENPASIVWYLASVTGKSILFAWIYNNTRGSLFVDVLFHASINTTTNVLLPIFYPEPSERLIATLGHTELVLTWVAVAVVVTVFKPGRLSRGSTAWLSEHRVESE